MNQFFNFLKSPPKDMFIDERDREREREREQKY